MRGESEQVDKQGGAAFQAPLFVTAAHELKAPLALMRQMALDLESGELTAAEVARIAQRMALTSERALRLTTNLTKQARLEDSMFSLEPLNPISICDEVVEEIKPLYQARGRRLEYNSRRRSLLGLANKDLLRRILLSFADNALHYGGDEDAVTITVQATEGGQYIRLGVRDYGPAVPIAVWREVATSLGVDRHAMHARPESSGLGMYIAAQFAEAMQARIGAIRHADGATFYVDIRTSHQLRLL